MNQIGNITAKSFLKYVKKYWYSIVICTVIVMAIFSGFFIYKNNEVDKNIRHLSIVKIDVLTAQGISSEMVDRAIKDDYKANFTESDTLNALYDSLFVSVYSKNKNASVLSIAAISSDFETTEKFHNYLKKELPPLLTGQYKIDNVTIVGDDSRIVKVYSPIGADINAAVDYDEIKNVYSLNPGQISYWAIVGILLSLIIMTIGIVFTKKTRFIDEINNDLLIGHYANGNMVNDSHLVKIMNLVQTKNSKPVYITFLNLSTKTIENVTLEAVTRVKNVSDKIEIVKAEDIDYDNYSDETVINPYILQKTNLTKKDVVFFEFDYNYDNNNFFAVDSIADYTFLVIDDRAKNKRQFKNIEKKVTHEKLGIIFLESKEREIN